MKLIYIADLWYPDQADCLPSVGYQRDHVDYHRDWDDRQRDYDTFLLNGFPSILPASLTNSLHNFAHEVTSGPVTRIDTRDDYVLVVGDVPHCDHAESRSAHPKFARIKRKTSMIFAQITSSAAVAFKPSLGGRDGPLRANLG